MEIIIKGFTKIESMLGDSIQYKLRTSNSKGEENSITVDCSTAVEGMWGLVKEPLFMALYQVIRKDILELVESGQVKDIKQLYPLEYNTYNTPSIPPPVENSFPDKIEFETSLFKSSLDHFSKKTAKKETKRRMSSLGESISDLRDQVNSIVKSRWAFTLFPIEKERTLASVYLSCKNKDELTSRVSALKDLSTWIDKEQINSILAEDIIDTKGSIYHLEKFMEQEFPKKDRDNVLGNLNDLQRILNDYMTHKDTEEAAVSFTELGIPWPKGEGQDYSVTWENILYKYFIFLKFLLKAVEPE